MRAIACTLVLASALVLAAGQIDTAFEWNFIDFTWPNASMREQFILTGQYNPTSVLPMDVDRDRAGRVFVSLLGTANTPVTLGLVTNALGFGGPLIQPYPNWSWFAPGSCETLQNVYRIWIDNCNRLWILDVGVKEGAISECTPKLVVFDLNTDRYIQTIRIPENIARGRNRRSLLATPVVDTEGPNCEKTTVYIADVFGNGLIIVDNNRIRRLEYPIFEPNPNALTITSGNVTTQFESGILGLSVSPQLFRNENKFLYFRPLSSYGLFAASVNELENSFYGRQIYFQGREDILPSQSIVMAFSGQGTLFFGMTRENGIGCWNKYRPLSRENIGLVAQDFDRLQYLNGMKVIKPSPAHPEEELWVLSNRFIHYLSGRLNRQQGVNFRILRGSVRNLVSNTFCNLPNDYKTVLQRQQE